ncbi:hypothetical protein AUEXF2481DRAFT_25893 [Aureobasidium subglaciale EXF-2481]|uniref:Uncharacterized protein n=1 Tax=Aureobasidium subglaciale (strain EXF-2481) TaxID=1043005 RepID=A0A074YQS4_AURSE|nr:uncharacterized protein AUEXF2481DRAFT_25893 [Aureobasidium subglaciale EXF-2481]KER00026.1 hypothetical protein AUEXF2481DRAFT_25893 [Aureobasidium subglaciale EXF-2481]
MLLNKGVDSNSEGGKYGNALEAASRGGHETILQILLNWRFDQLAEDEMSNAFTESHDSGYSSLGPLLRCEKHVSHEQVNALDRDEDAQSNLTVQTDIQSSAESQTFSNIKETAAREVKQSFLGISDISRALRRRS